MVGENIQMAREKLQSAKGQLMGNFNLGGKLFSSNPGILTNFQVGKRVQERISAVRGTRYTPAARTKKGGEKGVLSDNPLGVKERVIVV